MCIRKQIWNQIDLKRGDFRDATIVYLTFDNIQNSAKMKQTDVFVLFFYWNSINLISFIESFTKNCGFFKYNIKLFLKHLFLLSYFKLLTVIKRSELDKMFHLLWVFWNKMYKFGCFENQVQTSDTLLML